MIKQVTSTKPPMIQSRKPGPSGPGSWWDRLDPSAKAALMMSFIVAGLHQVSLSFPLIGILITGIFKVLIYYVQGMLVGYLAHKDSRYMGGSYARLGAVSACWNALLILSIQIILLPVMTSLTLGAILALVPLNILDHFATIFLNVCFTALGAWLYSRVGGQKLALLSCSIVAFIVALVTLVGVIVLIALFVIGTKLVHGA